MRDVQSNVSNIDETNVTTTLAEDLHITGTMTFKSSLMIEGTLDGEIISEGLLIVGPTAKVNAAVTTKNLVSHGQITGDVTASEQVVLKGTAVQTGNITTPYIIVESGSIFNGSCMMKREAAAEPPQHETGEEGGGFGTEKQGAHDSELRQQEQAVPMIREETGEHAAPISEELSGSSRGRSDTGHRRGNIDQGGAGRARGKSGRRGLVAGGAQDAWRTDAEGAKGAKKTAVLTAPGDLFGRGRSIDGPAPGYYIDSPNNEEVKNGKCQPICVRHR